MILRFFIYGILGWIVEILWSSFRTYVKTKDLRFMATTSLWTLPIYGLAAPLFEPLHNAIRFQPLVLRGIIYATGILLVEYLVGFLLKTLTGKVPWDYSYAKFSVQGLIRLDFFPLWFLLGLFLEQVHDRLVILTFRILDVF